MVSTDGLKAQMAEYKAEVEGLSKVDDILVWWKSRHEEGFAVAWVEVARYVLVLRGHAAGPERIFSRVRQTFGDTQHGCLEDEIEASIMAQVNSTEEYE